MLGIGGCGLYPFLSVPGSCAEFQIPGAVTGACGDMVAIPELTLTVCQPPAWVPRDGGATWSGCAWAGCARQCRAAVAVWLQYGQTSGWAWSWTEMRAGACPWHRSPWPRSVAATLLGKTLPVFLVWSNWNGFL